jgi:uncharacterized protein YbjT (DUF2867 family)
MRVAVVGGTGTAGRYTVEALRKAGHQIVIISRSQGVDLTTGVGLDKALTGVDTVIDVSSLMGPDAESTIKLFQKATVNLVKAEQKAKIRHHVLLSIVGIDRFEGNPHIAGKRLQEEMLSKTLLPVTIMRATQFHEFAGTLLSAVRKGNVAEIPPLLIQPVAASDVGEILVEIAGGAPHGRAADLAGPETHDLVDMARRTLAARGESIKLVPSWRTGWFGVDAAGEVLLPGPDARFARTTFDEWLTSVKARATSGV